MDDLSRFIASYTDADEPRIAFAWNGKHAKDFRDANNDFRKAVLGAVFKEAAAAPLALIRDLFCAETEYSREAWGIDNRVIALAEIMLARCGRAALMDFLRGKCQSFDASMACGAVRIDQQLAAELLDEAERRLAESTDDRERHLLKVGQKVFAERASGGTGDGKGM